MKKLMLLLTILTISVFTTACINNFAVQELNNTASAFMDKGDAEAAICRLKASLDLDNDVYQTHYNLAAAYNAAGRYDEAQSEAYKTLELKPDLYDAYYIAAAAQDGKTYKFLDDMLMKNEELDDETISSFVKQAEDTIEAYNMYLEKSPSAPEKEQIAEKIEELQNKINQYTGSLQNEQEKQKIQEEAGG